MFARRYVVLRLQRGRGGGGGGGALVDKVWVSKEDLTLTYFELEKN
jgi:hypothetical protein